MSARDPVAEVVESRLRQIADQEGFLLEWLGSEWPRQLRFGPVSVAGESYDIAMLRLASALLEPPEYRERMVECLRHSLGRPTPGS